MHITLYSIRWDDKVMKLQTIPEQRHYPKADQKTIFLSVLYSFRLKYPLHKGNCIQVNTIIA